MRPEMVQSRLEKNGSETAGQPGERYDLQKYCFHRVLPGTILAVSTRAAEVKVALLVVGVKQEPQHLVF